MALDARSRALVQGRYQKQGTTMEKEITNFQAKYGRRVLRFGFTQIPNILLQDTKALGLTGMELHLLCYLMSYGSAQEIADRVYPSLAMISKLTSFSSATIHKAKQGLINKGFIRVTRRPYQTNIYDLLPVREKLDVLAKKKIKDSFLIEKMDTETYGDLMGEWIVPTEGCSKTEHPLISKLNAINRD